MTLVRRAAVRISSWAVRWASPGCREWAEGLEREVAFIDGDWRALGWAIGSTRVLLDRREAPLDSIEKASAAAQDYFESKKTQTPIVFGVLASVATLLFSLFSLYAFSAWGSLNAMERTGIWVSVAILLCAGYRRYARRPRAIDPPAGLYETVVLYRSELQRVHENQYGWKGHLLNLGFDIYLSSQFYFFYRSAGIHELVQISPFIFLWVLAMLYSEARFYQKDRNSRRRIAELDALIARGVEGV